MKRWLMILLLGGLLLVACDDADYGEGYGEDYGEEEPDLDEPEPVNEESDVTVEESGGGTAVNPIYSTNECPFFEPENYTVECGTLTVAENRQTGSDKTIELAVAIMRSENPAPDPLIYLAGGPGGSGLVDFFDDAEGWEPFWQERDLIFVDQRGTGFSEPSLDCFEVDEAEEDDDPFSACADRLRESGVDLSAYNTAENAADIADLAQALGYDSWNILGVSYGTRLAFDVMRDHPEGIRSVILDSPFPPNVSIARDESVALWSVLQTLFADCEADDYCAETYPDLETTFLETVDTLAYDESYDIYAEDFLYVLEQMMFAGEEYGGLVPLLITQVGEKDLDLYYEIEGEISGFARRWADGDGDSEGMYNAVMCRDEYAFTNVSEVEDFVEDALPVELQESAIIKAEEMFSSCEVWDVGTAKPNEDEAVVSDIPTLVLVGAYDPATPPSWGELAMETLSEGQYLLLPYLGHSVVGVNECAQETAVSFLNAPSDPVDVGCVDEIESPYFE